MIELKDVSFVYNQGNVQNALRQINLTIHDGEVVLLCGESGCGKTTVTRLINGLIPHYYEGQMEGSVHVNGREVSRLPLYETAQIVGSVFQNPRSQFFNVDTTSELAFGCENQGLPKEVIESRIAETVHSLRIEPLMGRSIFRLSGGEKQKIACASVCSAEPMVLVLDEPSSNLDIRATQDLRRLIGDWKRQGKTVVIAEHRLYYLRELADRILYMKDGRIVHEFTPDELKKGTGSRLADLGLRPFSLLDVTKENPPDTGKKGSGEIRLHHFCFSYPKQSALQIDALLIPKNQVAAVIGHNGSGKSTFARCLCGLEKHAQGTMLNDGRVCKWKDRIRCCYMVMQDVNHQLFTESVLDEVLLSMPDQDVQKAEEILARLDLLHVKDLHPMSLSGGEKQRVAIASAMASERDLIVFDEPTSGLDLRHMREVAENVAVLKEMGKTVLIISHDLELIATSCTHVIHLESGRVIGSYPLDHKGMEQLQDFFTGSGPNQLPLQKPTRRTPDGRTDRRLENSLQVG